MPVIPSFTGFAATPNTASAFLGGAKLSADIAQDAARLSLERQRLSQSAQMAQMEMQAKAVSQERQALRDQQEMEMEKAYKEAQIGLRQRELQGEEKVLQFKTQQAAQKAMAQQSYQSEAQKMIAGGMNPAEAYQQAALQFGPQMDLPSGAYSAAFRGGGMNFPELGQVTQPSGRPDVDMIRTGPRSIARLPPSIKDLKQEEAVPARGVPGSVIFGNKLVRVPDQTRPLQSQLTKLEALHEKDTPGRLASQKAADPKKKMTSTDKMALETYRAREKKIAGLEDEIRELRAGPAAAPGNAAPKRFVWDSKQKKLVPK